MQFSPTSVSAKRILNFTMETELKVSGSYHRINIYLLAYSPRKLLGYINTVTNRICYRRCIISPNNDTAPVKSINLTCDQTIQQNTLKQKIGLALKWKRSAFLPYNPIMNVSGVKIINQSINQSNLFVKTQKYDNKLKSTVKHKSVVYRTQRQV